MLEELLIKFIGPSWGRMFIYGFLLGGAWQVIKYFVKEFERLDRRSEEAEKRFRETSSRFHDKK